MVPRVTTSDKEWCNHWKRMATSDNEWQRVTSMSGTMSDNEDNERQQLTTSDHDWQRMTTSGSTNNNEWYNEWKQIRVILGFRMKQLCNVKLQYIQQSLFGTIMQNRTFTEAATRGVL